MMLSSALLRSEPEIPDKKPWEIPYSICRHSESPPTASRLAAKAQHFFVTGTLALIHQSSAAATTPGDKTRTELRSTCARLLRGCRDGGRGTTRALGPPAAALPSNRIAMPSGSKRNWPKDAEDSRLSRTPVNTTRMGKPRGNGFAARAMAYSAQPFASPTRDDGHSTRHAQIAQIIMRSAGR